MNERRKLERHHVSNSLEVYDLDSGELLGRVVDLHTEGLMLLSERPIELNRSWALQVNLPMNLNGVSWTRKVAGIARASPAASIGPVCNSPICPRIPAAV